MKKRFFTLLGGVLYGALLSLTAQAQVWTDVTEKIVNPSFETDEASSNLKDSGQSGATGWTVTQSSLSNSQWGVASSECTIQGIASTLQTEDGGNYYYIRTNWNNDPNLGISQVIADLPAGMYKLTFLAATHSGNWSTVQHTVSLIEGDGQTSVKTLYSTGAAWTPFEVYINKESSTSTLTIKANMKAGSSGSSQHYQLLLDNLKLYYCEDLGASADNPVDLTGYISNPNIMNTNNTYVPRGWTSSSRSVGNGNYTEGTGNTQLEAWSGGNMYFDYNQTLAGLPNGMYKLTAYCHDSNQKGGHLYASSGDLIKKVNMTTDYSSITTGTINVTDGTLKIGIKSETTSGGSWMTGDSFTLSFIGFDASELLADLAEQIAEATFTEKHSASTETALSTAIAAAQALINAATGTKEEIETASSNLATAIADVQASISVYAQISSVNTAAAKLDAAGQAAYAPTLAAYDNGTLTTYEDAFEAYQTAIRAQNTNGADMTGAIINPNFDGNINGWVDNYTSGNHGYQSASYENGESFVNQFMECWTPSGALENGKLSQVITGLPEGEYTMSADLISCRQGQDDLTLTGVYIFAQSDALFKSDACATANKKPEKFSFGFKMTGEQVEIGLMTEGTNCNWVAFDNVTLTYDGPLQGNIFQDQLVEALKKYTDRAGVKGSAATISAYATAYATAITASTTDGQGNDYYKDALSELESADVALTASVADYANLEAAIKAVVYKVIDPEHTALEKAVEDAQKIYDEGSADSCAETIAGLNQAVKDAKVADYDYVTKDFQYSVELGDWIPNGPTGELTGQHWSGNNSRKYLEQSSAAWSQDAWSISYSQDVTLPAGDYVFKVAGRKASGNNCTLQLVVTDKTTSALIGTVSDFPEGDTGLGINKTGVTSFDPSDPEGFANDGMGRGFQWRYVKFSLTESTTVNIAVSAEAWKREQWVSFCDATVQTNNEANIAMITYNVALNDANTALANATYANVTGSERTDLADAVAADMTGKTKAEVEAATTALKELTTAFKEAAAAYDKYAAVLNSTVADLPYAAVAKKEAVATALAATPTTAAECLAAIEVINRALLEYYESNGRADGADGAKDVTDWIQNPLFTDGLNGWTSSQTGGNLGAPNNEPPTFSDGSNAAYYDYYNGDANNQHGYQTIKNMPAGVYYLTITVRADGNLNNVFVKIGDQKVTVNKIGATGGVYGRGWNDYSVEYTNAKMQDVTIEVYSTPDGGNKSGWFGFTNVRLIQLQAGAQLSINPTAQYGTFIAPFDVTIPEGVEAFTCLSTDGSTLVLDGLKETIPANKPVIVFSESEEGIDQTFYGKSTATEDTYTNGLLTGVYTATAAPVGSYVLMLSDDKAVFGTVVADHQPTVGANRCYFTAPADNEAKAFFFGRGTTNIDNLGINAPADDVIYDLTGRRVEKATKGIYIINGKKTYIK